ncbi:hypothetical protein GCM10009555_038180 [Acrocarpospora macrocephala]|uniref:Uncharacterized protein n=1 Tax=Acrocarpospora macrocephala TaxID=150177 RepID=A0A5M3WLE8_9ACTN|nr:hypothetical protein [Acrocarpospora macrocephala]GES09704.1 hypothetical protein Amac_033000 [Acrocarpospora macrocephala]
MDRPSQSYLTYALADSFQAQLITAACKGEAFDTETGLPDSIHREAQTITWFEHASDYMDNKWSKIAANSRRSTLEGMIAVTCALVRETRGAPGTEQLRDALRWAFLPSRKDVDQPEPVATTLR